MSPGTTPASVPPGATKSHGDLPRRMGLSTATALVVGGTFGIGVFVTTADMAHARLLAVVAGRPREAALGVAVVALGIPVYRLVVRKQNG